MAHTLSAWSISALLCFSSLPAAAFESRSLDSVVSLLPLWPGHQRGGEAGTPPGSAPEASAVAVLPGGYLATALHTVDRASDIMVRLRDGRRLPASFVAGDPATDLALLKIAEDIPVLETAPPPPLGHRVCAIGNQFGLDLSVTCGVVSATERNGTGFNPIEDFIQTDATINPGASGGALVDDEGRLVGLISAIFTKESDANIGVNFAVSSALLTRVVEDLAAHGRVLRASPGFRIARLSPEEAAATPGLHIDRLDSAGPAAAAGLKAGDLLVAVGDREVRKPGDLAAAIYLSRPGESLRVTVLRDGQSQEIAWQLPPRDEGG